MSFDQGAWLSRSKLIAAFVAGTLTGAAVSAAAVGQYPFERLQVFAEALSVIHDRYVDTRDPDELIYDAIGGLTQGLDDHSIFMNPERYREIREQTSGEYYGVGISVETLGDRLKVITPLDGSPASDAGILAGDEIIAVDGLLVSELGGPEALGRIKGERGTIVALRLVREGLDAPLDVVVTRDQVRTRSVELKPMADGLAWLRIERFQRRTVEEVKRALADAADQGLSLTGLVLDLRDNPGGYLAQASAVADLWLREGVIVSTVDRASDPERDLAHAAGTDLESSLVVLVNEGSASASEIVAGALQDHGRAVVVGLPTYGKGSVQQFFDLSDGSALKLTTARYYTPRGTSIHGTGILPNFAVGAPDDDQPGLDLSSLFASFDSTPDWVRKDRALHLAYGLLVDDARVRHWFESARDELAVQDGAKAPSD